MSLRDQSFHERHKTLPQRMTAAGIADWPSFFFILMLLVTLLYSSFRYPFQISSSLTSPTYSDTPFWLIAGKYVLIAIICSALFLSTIRTPGRQVQRWITVTFIVLAFMGAFSIIRGLLLGANDLVELGFFLFASIPALLFLARRGVSSRLIVQILLLFVGVALSAEVIQVLLFAAFGRLPALAYARSISVRFGSVWDDPNGFAFFVGLLLPIAILAIRNKVARVAVTVGLVVCLLLTQSLTGNVAVAISLVIAGVFLSRRPNVTLIVTGSVVALVSTAVLLLGRVTSAGPVAQIATSKAGSVAQHLDGLNVLRSTTTLDLLGVSPAYVVAESAYISMLTNLGLVFTILYAALGAVALLRLFLSIRGGTREILDIGLFTFILAYLAGLMNLSLHVAFPVDFLYLIAVMIAFRGGVVTTGDERFGTRSWKQRVRWN